MSSQLSSGICLRLHDAASADIQELGSGHTVQLLSIKKVTPTASASNPSMDRYRIIISDGVHFVQAMLATQLNRLVYEEEIVKNSVVIIDKLTCNFAAEKRLIIVLDLRVVVKEEEKIGNPVAIVLGGASAEQTSGSPPPGAASTSITPIPPRQQPPRPQPSRQNQPARGGRAGSTFLIEGLSPYQNNWTIKARVTQKSEIRTWSNQRGEGKLFNVTFMDESGEIRATGFNAVVDELYEKLEEGKVYYVSKARVNLAKKKFSNIQNDYELSLEKNTEIEECLETSGLPMIKYNFIQLAELEAQTKDSTCDVVAIVKEVGPLGEIVSSKTSRTIPKRELTLVDKSGYSVRLTLWGKQAEQYNADGHPVIAFKGVKVGDFGGRSLSMVSTSMMSVDPDIDESHLLRGWYDSIGVEQAFQAHSNAMSSMGSANFNRSEARHLSDVKESQLGMSDKADYFSCRSTIMHLKSENISYPACPTQGCNKKVIDVGDGWKCEKCDKTFERPEHRYIISMAVADWSTQAWLQGFNDAGVAVLGKSADELMEIKERNEAEYNTVMANASGNTYNFTCRAKQDTYNETTRVRYGIVKINPVNYHEEAIFLRDLLNSPWAR